jgi:hypothetical protein
MQRSILPSTARKAARDDKRAVVHVNRRGNTHRMAKYKGPAGYVEDLWDDGERLTYWPGPHIADYGEIIWGRRNHDKLAHFETWAYERTKHLRPEDRYSKISGLLPNGVIGNHALSHLDFLKARHPAEWWRYYEGGERWDLPRQLRPRVYYPRLVKPLIPLGDLTSDV